MPFATATLRIPAAALPRARGATAPMRNPAEEAFLDAFDAHADAIFKHVSLRVGSRERARDVTQDAFIKAWDYLAKGGEVREWRSFLYRVANNLIIDEYRRAKDLSLDALMEDGAADGALLAAPEGLAEREEALDRERAVAQVRALIPELPEPYRGALVL
ncbi:MAG: RNA polymerase sigma factor, partial [Patescibacteria group bacterium]|nr:RNA polymerase sigma factor [Patescibacteria group bacterium]